MGDELKAGVGLSRKWGAREAGREVALKTLEKLNGENPKFFLLFSTIHYEKHGGFQELLNGVWDVLPEATPLIGGTVTGFMNNYGCYSRGVTALAVSSTYMDVAVGVGRGTKRDPRKAAQQCAEMIKKGLKNSDYKNKFLLNLISASVIPDIPPFGRKKIIKGLSVKTMMRLFNVSQRVLQKGAGREDEVMEELVKLLRDYCMLGGGTLDDGKGLINFQFYDKNVLTNSIVSLGIKTQLKFDVLTTHSMKKTDIGFRITKTSKDGRIIHEINGKPAASELLRLLDWPEDFLNDDTWFKTTYYFPLGFRVSKNSNEFGPRVIAGVFGDSLVTTIRSKDSEGTILTIDGERLLQTIDNNLKTFSNKPLFGLIASCTTRLETMGSKVYDARDRILTFFGDHPFIVIYVGGESTYSSKRGLSFVNMSFNTVVFWNDDS
ncbi:MAG TPA: hypothetical protein EYP23_03500 [Thermoplasmata archaeon]|nr:hypothetical protein [Thermoplasmata archaeon]